MDAGRIDETSGKKWEEVKNGQLSFVSSQLLVVSSQLLVVSGQLLGQWQFSY